MASGKGFEKPRRCQISAYMTFVTATRASPCAKAETVLTIGRLLGHRDPTTTLKYIHLADTMARDAVEAVGAALER